jgi:lysophospholipase L1-like esterase
MKVQLFGGLLLIGLFLAGFTFNAKKKRVVFLGDSITQAAVSPGGYISLLREALQGSGRAEAFELMGAGISGNKVPDLLNRLDKDVLQQKPDLVLIYIGVNDVWHFTHPSTGGKGTPKDVYEKGLNELIARIRKTGAKVVLCTPAAIGEKHDGSNAQDAMLDEYSDISRQVAKSNKLPLCDLRKAFMAYSKANNSSNQEKDVLTNDGVHLNAAGNAFVALQMMPYLLE